MRFDVNTPLHIHAKAMRDFQKKRCSVCGKKLSTFKKVTKNRKFCSDKCKKIHFFQKTWNDRHNSSAFIVPWSSSLALPIVRNLY